MIDPEYDFQLGSQREREHHLYITATDTEISGLHADGCNAFGRTVTLPGWRASNEDAAYVLALVAPKDGCWNPCFN